MAVTVDAIRRGQVSLPAAVSALVQAGQVDFSTGSGEIWIVGPGVGYAVSKYAQLYPAGQAPSLPAGTTFTPAAGAPGGSIIPAVPTPSGDVGNAVVVAEPEAGIQIGRTTATRGVTAYVEAPGRGEAVELQGQKLRRSRRLGGTYTAAQKAIAVRRTHGPAWYSLYLAPSKAAAAVVE